MKESTNTPVDIGSPIRFPSNSFALFRSLTAISVWAFAATGLVIGITGGGLPTLIWGSLVVGIVLSLMVVSFAEFGSAYPSIAGCLFIASKLGGPKYGRICGYMTGGMHALASLITPACLVASHTPFITTMAQIMHPNYEPQRWHIFLLYQITNVAIMYTCFKSSRILDKVASFAGFLTFALFFAAIGAIIGCADPLASSEIVWSKIENKTGWPTGLAFLIGTASPLSGYGPTHWMLNMADEVQNPRRSIPIAMFMQQIGSVLTLFFFFIAIGYGAGSDWDAILGSPYTAPMGAVFETATRSKAGAVIFMSFMYILAIMTAASYISAACRLIYGFAKSKGFPLEKWLTHYDVKNQIPSNIALTIFFVNAILGTVELGSSTGIATLVGAATVSFTLGYLPIFIGYLLTGGEHLGRQGWFRLPRPISLALASFNIFSILAQSVVLCLPPINPITTENMNWASAVSGSLAVLLVIVYFVHGQYTYDSNADLMLSSQKDTKEIK
ncbi:hypothetical protein HG530_013900 [Fusarium avenaceum]|nr:hypothetical protein HG530_013900 [Fusarium avenaceum]